MIMGSRMRGRRRKHGAVGAVGAVDAVDAVVRRGHCEMRGRRASAQSGRTRVVPLTSCMRARCSLRMDHRRFFQGAESAVEHVRYLAVHE
jgi:hypothetical protein